MPLEEPTTIAAPGSLLEMQQILASINNVQSQLTTLGSELTTLTAQVQAVIDNSLILEG